MIDLDRYVCPGDHCMETLRVHHHEGDDGDEESVADLDFWPDGFWSMCCPKCGWEAEGGTEARDAGARPPTLRDRLPADVLGALENPRSVWRSTKPPRDRMVLMAYRRPDGLVALRRPQRFDGRRQWDPVEELWAELPVLPGRRCD